MHRLRGRSTHTHTLCVCVAPVAARGALVCTHTRHAHTDSMCDNIAIIFENLWTPPYLFGLGAVLGSRLRLALRAGAQPQGGRGAVVCPESPLR